MNLDERLIIEVQQYPGLYDQTSPDYRDLRKKETMWQAVADSLGLHVRECQARWRVLRDKFAREMRKNVNAKKAGASALQVYQGSWALMSHLMFLTSHVRHRTAQGPLKKKTPSEAGISEEEEECDLSDEEPPSPSPPLTKRIKTEVDSYQSSKESSALWQGTLEWEADAERLFCLSLVPVMRRLDPDKRSLAKLHIQRLLHNLEFPQVKVELRSG
ncbi:transcription factor Adf-1-like [Eriocheir sinensis]|uniref:transcription factor Adf-1-like n=1 Tax=Eriocheir sinensis TaxID=95602 RepID=UPI0021C97DF6|nr:transcription factor Adf-1-like [Eriocheir sinensis]